MLAPLYAIESFVSFVEIPLHVLLLILLFTSSTIIVVVLPTILMDKRVDEVHGMNTFSVRFGPKRTIQVMILGMVLQALSLALFCLLFLFSGNYLAVLISIFFLFSLANLIRNLYFSKQPEIHAERLSTHLPRIFILGITFLLNMGIMFNLTGFNPNLLIDDVIKLVLRVSGLIRCF